MDLGFFDIFFPMLGALLAWSVIMELLHLGIKYLQIRKDKEAVAKLQAALKSGDFTGIDLMDPITGLPMNPQDFAGVTTTSGGEYKGAGQYL